MGALLHLIEDGFGLAEDYNCAERIVYGANRAYDLRLPEEAKHMMAGFGGGMGLGATCGTVSGAVAVISAHLVEDKAHATPGLKPATQSFLRAFEQKMGALDCPHLRSRDRTKEQGCDAVVRAAAELLDELVQELA